MNKLQAIFANEWVLIPLVSVCVIIIAYLWSNKIVDGLYKKSMTNREEIFRLLDLMFVDTDKKKLNILLLLLSFGLGFIIFFLFLPNVVAGLCFASLVTVLGWTLPLMVVRSLWESRASRFVEQMVDGLTIMGNGINAGLAVTQAMERVVTNLANPISQEFGLVLSQISLGRSIEDALIELSVRIPKPDVQMFVTAINILKETGGNLPETFATIVVTIRERQKIEKKIQAMTAQGIMQGIIISLVPFVLIVVFLLVDPAFVKPMFSTTLGLVFLFIMLILVIIGGIAIRKIVTIKV